VCYPSFPNYLLFLLHTCIIIITSLEIHTFLVPSKHVLKIYTINNSGYWERLWITHSKFHYFAPLLRSVCISKTCYHYCFFTRDMTKKRVTQLLEDALLSTGPALCFAHDGIYIFLRHTFTAQTDGYDETDLYFGLHDLRISILPASTGRTELTRRQSTTLGISGCDTRPLLTNFQNLFTSKRVYIY
jgi:hypothetical protein